MVRCANTGRRERVRRVSRVTIEGSVHHVFCHAPSRNLLRFTMFSSFQLRDCRYQCDKVTERYAPPHDNYLSLVVSSDSVLGEHAFIDVFLMATGVARGRSMVRREYEGVHKPRRVTRKGAHNLMMRANVISSRLFRVSFGRCFWCRISTPSSRIIKSAGILSMCFRTAQQSSIMQFHVTGILPQDSAGGLVGLAAPIPHVVEGGGLVYEAMATSNVTVGGVAAQRGIMTTTVLGGDVTIAVSICLPLIVLWTASGAWLCGQPAFFTSVDICRCRGCSTSTQFPSLLVMSVHESKFAVVHDKPERILLFKTFPVPLFSHSGAFFPVHPAGGQIMMYIIEEDGAITNGDEQIEVTTAAILHQNFKGPA